MMRMDYEARALEFLALTAEAHLDASLPNFEAWLYRDLAHAITYALLSVSSAFAEASHQERPYRN